MSDKTDQQPTRWLIRQPIALELDLILTAISGRFPTEIFTEDILNFFQQISPERRSQLFAMFDDPQHISSLLEYAADMANVLLDEDYERTMMAIRELSLTDALANVEQQAHSFALTADPSLPLPERLIDLEWRLQSAIYSSAGFTETGILSHAHTQKQKIAFAVRILRDGDLHSRFWFWLDRFYFEIYRSWRETRLPTLETLKNRALTALGEHNGADPLADLSWLPPQSPVLRSPELHAAVSEGRLQLCFWVEPLEIPDAWTLIPGLLIMTFAQSSTLFQSFQTYATDLATRTNALSDPTRLTILRMIRNYSMINTEIAAALQLSRPTVSVHAKILREAGLIRSHQQGRLVRHELVPSEVRRLFHDLERFLDLPPESSEEE